MQGRLVNVIRAVATILFAAICVTPAAHAANGSPETAPPIRSGELTPNQLTAGRSLSPEEAVAACGPAAAVALARAIGRDVSLDDAVAAARQVGWTPANGMAGPTSQLALLERLGVSARLEDGIDRARIAREVQAGSPVIVRSVGNGGHYFVLERYDPGNDRFDVGQSAAVLTRAAGRRWFTLGELAALNVGTPRQAIFLDRAAVPLFR